MNIVALVGTIVETPTIHEFEKGFKGAFLTLRVIKPFKSIEGNYEADFIRCVLWEGIAQSTCEYCMKGDVIAVRGRVGTYTEEVTFNCENEEHKKKINTNHVIVERVTFISTSKKNKSEENKDLLDDD